MDIEDFANRTKKLMWVAFGFWFLIVVGIGVVLVHFIGKYW